MKINRIFQWLGLCLLAFPVFLFVSSGAAAAASPFVPVTYSGATDIAAVAVNDSGQVAGSWIKDSVGGAFFYDGTSYFSIPAPAGVTLIGIDAYGINNSGQVVGSYDDQTGRHGFIYSAGNTVALPDPPGSSNNTYAYGINDSGQVVGTYYDPSGHHGFIYSGGAFTTFDFPGAESATTSVYAINNNGQICGEYRDTSGILHGFVYNLSNGSSTTIDIPGATWVTPEGVNDSGQVSGCYYVAGGISYGFVYDTATGDLTAVLEYPGAVSTEVYGISRNGQVAGWYTLAGVTYSFTATLPQYTFTSFDPGNSTGTYATNYNAINNSGQVTGYYDTSTMLGFVYTLGTPPALYSFEADPTAVETMPLGINDSGTVVGWWSPGLADEGFEYSNGSVPKTIIYNNGTNDLSTLLTGINDNDLIAGYYIDAGTGTYHAFLYDGSNSTPFTVFSPSAYSTAPVAINNNNQVVGWTFNGTGTSGFLYDSATNEFITLDPDNDPSTYAEADAINDAGEVAGGYLSGASPTVGFGFLYDTGGNYTTFVVPGATGFGITGMNNAEEVSGVFTDTSGIEHGYVYNGGIFTILDFPAAGTTSTSVMGVNDSGQVGGYYQNPTAHGFVAAPTHATTYYRDKDGDGYGDPNDSISSPYPTPPQGYVTNSLDCNDSDATVHPGAGPVCGEDVGCTGTTYEGAACQELTGAGVSTPVPPAANQSMWVTASFTNSSASPIVTLRPDCRTVTFTVEDSSHKIVDPECNVLPAYGFPDDLITIQPGETVTVNCNVADLVAPGALKPGGSYTIQAVYGNSWHDPDYNTATRVCSNPPCYPDVWNGAVKAGTTSVTLQNSAVNRLPGSLSFPSPPNLQQWSAGWAQAEPSGCEITAKLTLAPGISFPSGDSFIGATMTLNGVDSDSPPEVQSDGSLQATFDCTEAVNSLGALAPTVYPTVEARLGSGDVVVWAKTPVTIGGAQTTTSLASSANPSTLGQSVTFTAAAGSNSGTPTGGTVTFSDGATTLGTVDLFGGQAEFDTSSLSVGPHDITATYNPDTGSGFQASSASVTQQVNNLCYWSGFYAPVSMPSVLNTVKAGQTVPLKWLLTDADGNGISDPSTFVGVEVRPVSCEDVGQYTAAAVDGDSAGSSGLQYLGDGYWQFNWKTSKGSSGCVSVYVEYKNGVGTTAQSPAANFEFK